MADMADDKKTLPKPAAPTLKIMRGELGTSMKLLKISQESLQSATNPNATKTETAKFRITQLQSHGQSSLAYSSLQSGMQYYMHPEYGYVAYRPMRDGPDSVCVLADPICSPENLKNLIDEFLKVKKDPIFMHCSHATGKILNEYGFSVNELGVETIIDVQNFDLVGSKKEQLRRARNGAKKDNLSVIEIEAVDDQMLAALKKISDDWMAGKVVNSNEMQFIVRPLVYIDEIDVRKFVAIKDKEIVGMVIFDPMYDDNRVSGYIANHLRSNLERPYSVVDFIILEALDKFKEEGIRDLSLGLSPLFKVDDSQEFRYSRLLKLILQYAFENANYVYNFKNLAQHKSKYRPELKGAREEKVYCAMKTRFFLSRMHDVNNLLGLHPVRTTLYHCAQRAADYFHTLVEHKGETEKPESKKSDSDKPKNTESKKSESKKPESKKQEPK